MNQFFVYLHDISSKLAQTYNLDIGMFFTIYVFSILPIYFGFFLMLYGSTRKLRWRDIFSFRIKNGLKFTTQVKIGLFLHVFGWIMPYLYIFIFGKNLSVWVYAIVFCIFLVSMYFLYKKIMLQTKSTALHDIDIIKSVHINVEQEINKLWDIYNKTFESVNEISPCKQSLDRDHFIEVLHDSTVIKYLLFKKGIGIIGLVLITNDFKNTQWISPDYFRVNFPDEYRNRLIYYFVGLAIHHEFRGNRYSTSLIERVIDDLPVDAIVGFDHSRNVNPMLHYFTKIVRQAKDLKRIHIDRQHYHVVCRKK